MSNLIYLGIGLFLGIILMGIVVFKKAPSLMMLEDESKYDFETTISNFEKEVNLAGWKISTIHDMQEILKGFAMILGK